MNKAILMGVLALGMSCSYRMGRGLPTDPTLTIGNVQAASSLQGAEQVIAGAFARELARRSGNGMEQPVDLQVLFLEDRPTASASQQSRIRMALVLSARAGDPIEVAGTRVYAGSAEAMKNSRRRDQALNSLTTELVQEGLPQLLMTQQER